jgi:hypothetical protein
MDRKAALHELKHQVRKHRIADNDVNSLVQEDSNETNTSKASVTNELKNYVVLHGNEQVAVDDVWGIGKSIGIKFNGDKANMFNVLSHRGRRSVCGGGGSVGEGVVKDDKGVGRK